ncbi:hypothetical protein FGO68_gene12476 [Halteria grandinella]|uniref:Uncharacterized protein n=1 Tax=Halteria grandinella TaxID=5974 RepID=A0A8J8NR03_HALGN|nr:hypothetical protein FGO68_gene12476 [Halteria grandinella]
MYAQTHHLMTAIFEQTAISLFLIKTALIPNFPHVRRSDLKLDTKERVSHRLSLEVSEMPTDFLREVNAAAVCIAKRRQNSCSQCQNGTKGRELSIFALKTCKFKERWKSLR